MSLEAVKVVVITEKLIAEKVCALIEACGATGYTVVAAGGKGSRSIRSANRARVVDEFSNVKIEVVTPDVAMANQIAESVIDEFLNDYSGITYFETVQIVRSQKFRR
ncbi:MAG: hypothetical protein AAF648_15895 [Pseudomonadota bacterium]